MGWLRQAVVDLRPLRRREFRLLFGAQAVSLAGSQVTYVAIPYQAWRLTRSPLAVGLLGLAELLPLLATALPGGALADARDRRRTVQATELGLAALAAALAGNALLARPHLWVLYAAAAGAAALQGLQRPSLDALPPRLVAREELPAAAALEGLRGSLGMVAGPALAGLLVAAAGLPAAYTVDVASFGCSLLLLSRMRAVPPAEALPGPRAVREGCATRAAGPSCSAPTWSTWWRWSSACRWRCSRRSPTASAAPACSGCCTRRPRPARCWPTRPAAGPAGCAGTAWRSCWRPAPGGWGWPPSA